MNCATKHFLAAGVSTLGLMVGAAQADIIHADDVIAQFSMCIGNDCVNGESFGFDTLRLKENNLRIKFDDTSNSASFPRNDWQLTANDTSNGGAEKFSIDDITGSRTPFTILAGARTNALFVDAQGDVGFGTSNPVVGLHSVDGDTPTLRLEQDGSSGFTAQTWDVAGNETNFFIRDVSNSSTLPFRIKPGAPTSSIYIGDGGDVGFNTSSPRAPLDIRNSDDDTVDDPQILVIQSSGTRTIRTMAKFKNNGGGQIVLEDSSFAEQWKMAQQNGGTRDYLIIDENDADGVEFRLTRGGDLTISGSLITTGGGGLCTAADPCDAVFDPTVYKVPSIEDHAALMWENQYLPAVGPTGADAPIDMTKKMLRMLNELEHAHIYIEELHERVKALESRG
jgi:hypothetical protein